MNINSHKAIELLYEDNLTYQDNLDQKKVCLFRFCMSGRQKTFENQSQLDFMEN